MKRRQRNPRQKQRRNNLFHKVKMPRNGAFLLFCDIIKLMRLNVTKYAIGFFVLCLLAIFSAANVVADVTTTPNASSPTSTTQPSTQDANAAKRVQLQQQLDQLEQEIQSLQDNVQEQTSKKKTLNSQLTALQKKMYRTQLEIRHLDLIIQQLDQKIGDIDTKVAKTSTDIEKQKSRIEFVLQQIYQQDDASFLEIVFGYDNFSDFYNHLQNTSDLEEGMRQALLNLQDARKNLENNREQSVALQEEQQSLLSEQEFQQQDFKKQQGAKQQLLNETKGKESYYQKLVVDRQKTAAEIRNELFVLQNAGVQLSFGDAYQHALYASQITGVRPAFLLALLQRESSWGQNVGKCYLVNADTGAGKHVTTGKAVSKVMKPDRDVAPFVQITQQLGRDPYSTAVSCPNPNYGYGGAMGPAQFIPSTWVSYIDKAASLLNHAPDPWDIRDSFTTSAIKLANAGAASQNSKDEWKAAMVYYAGGNWNNRAYWGYADWIMDKAEEYQKDIDVLNGKGN